MNLAVVREVLVARYDLSEPGSGRDRTRTVKL